MAIDTLLQEWREDVGMNGHRGVVVVGTVMVVMIVVVVVELVYHVEVDLTVVKW